MKPLVTAVVTVLAFAQLLFAQPGFQQAVVEGRSIAKKAQVDAHERVYDEANILVIEVDDGVPDSPPLIDGVTVIAASKEKKEQFAMLLKASVFTPGISMRWGGLEMNVAQVQTLDEYMDGLERGYKSNKANYEKANPGEKYSLSDFDYPQIRAKIEQQLHGHDAVVQRYIHIKRSGEK